MTGWNIDMIPDGSDALCGAVLAGDYHGGQMTALYALASSGSLELYPGEGLARLIREVSDAVACAEEQGYWEDVESLRALLVWLEHHDEAGVEE